MGQQKRNRARGLGPILGLNLPSKGHCIKAKGVDFGLHSFICLSWNREELHHSCVLSPFFPCTLALLLRIRSFPHSPCSRFSPLFFSSLSPLRLRSSLDRIRGRCPWQHYNNFKWTSSHKEVAWRLSTLKRQAARSPRHVGLHQEDVTTFWRHCWGGGNFA